MNNNECFVIGSWVDNKIKEQNLIEVIKNLKDKDYPVCLVAPYPLSKDIQEMVDYYIYEKENVLSIDWRLTFWREQNGVRTERPSLVPYHGVACLMNIRNAVDLLLTKQKYKYIHYNEADVVYDFDTYIDTFKTKIIDEDKQALFVHYQDNNYRTDIFSVNISWFNAAIPRAQSWKEYTDLWLNGNYILEYWFTYHIQNYSEEYNKVLLNIGEQPKEGIYFLDNFEIGNKWTQAHAVEWEPDSRSLLDFADAPFDKIEGFIKILTELYKNKKANPNIVQIGVGDLTKVWAWYISKYSGSYIGCDTNKDNITIAEQNLRKYITGNDKSTNVSLTQKHCRPFLDQYNKQIDLLYLNIPENDDELYHLRLILDAKNKISIGGYIMFTGIAAYYLLGGDSFTCIHKGDYYIFRRDI